MSETTARITNVETGCYIDGSRGIYALKRACEIAMTYGWTPDGGYQAARDAYYGSILGAIDADVFTSYVDEAEAWLNDNTDGPGCWSWNDGDFGYYVDEDDAS